MGEDTPSRKADSTICAGYCPTIAVNALFPTGLMVPFPSPCIFQYQGLSTCWALASAVLAMVTLEMVTSLSTIETTPNSTSWSCDIVNRRSDLYLESFMQLCFNCAM